MLSFWKWKRSLSRKTLCSLLIESDVIGFYICFKRTQFIALFAIVVFNLQIVWLRKYHLLFCNRFLLFWNWNRNSKLILKLISRKPDFWKVINYSVPTFHIHFFYLKFVIIMIIIVNNNMMKLRNFQGICSNCTFHILMNWIPLILQDVIHTIKPFFYVY